MVTALIGVLGVVLGAVVSAFISSWLQKRRISDKEQFYSWRVVFDRTAFRGPYSWHSAQEPFIDAMKQTIRAINTGIVFHPGLGEDTVHRGKGEEPATQSGVAARYGPSREKVAQYRCRRGGSYGRHSCIP